MSATSSCFSFRPQYGIIDLLVTAPTNGRQKSQLSKVKHLCGLFERKTYIILITIIIITIIIIIIIIIIILFEVIRIRYLLRADSAFAMIQIPVEKSLIWTHLRTLMYRLQLSSWVKEGWNNRSRQ